MIDADDVQRAIDAFEGGADRRYFFQKISSPEWIRPLKEKKVFDSLPEPIREGEYVQYPDWPEGQYLLRMAEETDDREVQELILEVLLSVPKTENWRVERTLAEIALALPSDLAKRWVSVEEEQLGNVRQVPPLKEKVLGELAVHVAQEDSVKFALYFMRKLLEVFPDEGDSEDRVFGKSQSQIRMEEWRYEDLLREHLPMLIDLGGLDVLRILLCPLLEDAVRYDLPDSNENGDYSWIWKPTIEGNERVHAPHEVLTVALRDAVEQLAKENEELIPEVIRLLEDQDPLRPVFQRIALHLMRLYPDVARDQIVEHVLDRELLNERGTWHEYALLLKEVFPAFDETERRRLLGNIFSGPSLDAEVVEDLSEKRLQERIDRWKLRRLSLISEHLTGDAADKYQALVEKYGKYDNPEGPEFGASATWVGPTSPKGEDELSSRSPEKVIEYLLSWEPSGEPMAPSPEGLGRIFESVVSQNPDAFAALADRFQALDPTYVRSFISGIEKSSGDFNWEPVLEFCEWVVTQPRKPEDRQLPPATYGDNVDPDWGWTRKRIASLLQKGMEGDAIPFALRERVWSILEILAEDSEPTPEYEAKYGGDNMDPLTLSINTVRGEAMHAVVQYALWVRKHELSAGSDPTPDGFEHMPEVQEVLDRHLNIEVDPSLAVRAVYGQRFPQLYLVDSTWAQHNRERIFPTREEEQDYRVAAWGAYLFSSGIYKDIFAALREEYEAAIDRLPAGGEAGMRDTKRDLAEHLMAAYWRGDEGLDDDGLIKRFFAAADDNLRNYAIQRIGQYAENPGIDESEVPGIRQRLRDLWDFRLTAAKEGGNGDAFNEELAAFGWWLTSGEFNEEYVLQKMIETLQITGNAKPEIEVIEALAELSEEYPAETLECLRLIVHGDGRQWRIYGHKKEETRRVLKNALESADEQVQNKAEALTNYLGAQGFFQFRDLLS